MQILKLPHLPHAFQHILLGNLHHKPTLKIVHKFASRLLQNRSDHPPITLPFFEIHSHSVTLPEFLFQLLLGTHASQQPLIDNAYPIA
jgi:hypothetical protein